MAENSKIEWTNHTFNPWIGCTKVSPACDNCYAEAMMDLRLSKAKWGAGEDRVRTSASNWNQPRRWNLQALQSGQPTTVFCASLADVFDNEVDPLWRHHLFQLIEETPALTWLLLTKRIGNVIKMTDPLSGHRLVPKNAAIGASIVDQDEWDRDAGKLRDVGQQTGAAFVFASVEPMLGPIATRGDLPDWVIVGGESGPQARPMSPLWAREMRDQCKASKTPFFFKQWGEWAPAHPVPSGTPGRYAFGDYDFDRTRMVEVDHYPRQFDLLGSRARMERVGKKAAGSLLDGLAWRGMPARIMGSDKVSSRTNSTGETNNETSRGLES